MGGAVFPPCYLPGAKLWWGSATSDTTGDAQRAQTNLMRTEAETELCLSISCRGTGWRWSAAGTGALGAADLGVEKALLEEVAINPTVELPERTQDWEIGSWRAQTEACAPGPRRKESDPTGACPGLACGCRESPARLLQGWGH